MLSEVYIVHWMTEDPAISYIDRIKVFSKQQDAIDYAKSIGWDNPFVACNYKLGVMNIYSCEQTIGIMKTVIHDSALQARSK
jgi:hypothetical protein